MTTAIIELVLITSLCCCLSPPGPVTGFGGCVPNEIDLNSQLVNESTSKPVARQITVKQRLIQLKAHCKKGKLVDGKNKPIYLYQLIGCWGNPPDDYLDLLKHQEEEIRRLKRKYIVIQISCAQSGDLRTISQNSR
jgi:hypothetical protein